MVGLVDVCRDYVPPMTDINSDPLPQRKLVTGRAGELLDLTTAVFLLRKTEEERNELLERLLLCVEWYLTYTYVEFGA